MRTPRQPSSFLVVMVDQLAAGWLPFYGHRQVKVPQLSALAARSVTFQSAYAPSPLCAPSRSAMLAGRRCSRIGVYDNAAELAASVPTVAHHLRAAGYHTCLAGKMHFVGPDQLHGFEQRLTADIYPAGVDWTPDWTRPVSERLPWYHSMESILTPARCTASMQTDFDDEVAFQAVRHIHDLARGRHQSPFLLVVSFTNPHDPWEIPPRFWDLYDPGQIDPPTVPALSGERCDPHSRRLREMCGADQVTLSDEQIIRARHAYYAAISYVDERIGELLNALAVTGLDASTTVIFTADHGEFLGERGLWYKMSFLEPSARVPLLIRPPGGCDPVLVEDPVSLLDLTPTLLELAAGPGALDGLDLDGHSLAALVPGFAATAGGCAEEIAGGPADRPAVLCEYLAEGVTAPAAMLRAGRHKLIVCPGDPDQLYDLRADPLELTNLAVRAEHEATLAALRQQLLAEVDLGAIERLVLASQRDRRAVAAALARGELCAWDYSPSPNGKGRYVRTRTDLYELQRRARLEAPAHRPGMSPAGG
jgi:choline-sulfatase